MHTGKKADNWDYRTLDSNSSTTISTSVYYQAEAIHITDINQPIHKTAQLSLCKGLFGLHIRRGRGRPKKFNPHTQINRTRTDKKRRKSKKGARTPHLHIETITEHNSDNRLTIYDAERDKENLAKRIYQDAIDMGLQCTGDTEQTINNIEATL